MPMKKKSRPAARWPASQIILVAVVVSPFALLIYSVIASIRYDREITAEVHARFEPVACEVLDIGRREGTHRLRPNPDSKRTHELTTGFDPIIEYRYEWRGVTYRSRAFSPAVRTIGSSEVEAFDRTYAVGTRHQCKLDSERPERAFIAW
jgi:hypothetical protein